MLGKTFSIIMLMSFVTALFTGNMQRLSFEMIKAAGDGVTLCVTLLGMMCFWSGIMNVLKEAGALNVLGRLLEKPISLVFDKKSLTNADKQNLAASFAADFLGLGNAALPFGIAAMKGLCGKNGYATDNGIMHAVLNTVPIQLVPSTLIALRVKHESCNPTDVIPYIWLCSVVITVFAVITCKLLARIWEKGEEK